MNRCKTVRLLAAVASLAVGDACAAFGDPDPTFVGPSEYCMDTFATTGGKFAYVGRLATRFEVLRLRPDGSPDLAWGDRGTVTLPIPEGRAISVRPAGLLPLPDGGLLVIDEYLVRISKEGRIDNAYGRDGLSDPIVPGGQGLRHLASFALQPDGGLITLTRERARVATFTRTDARGQRDPAFGVDGLLTVELPSEDFTIFAWGVPSPGSIEYSGYARIRSGAVQPMLQRTGSGNVPIRGRILPDVTLGGWVSPNVQVQPDGAVLIASRVCLGGSCTAAAVARFGPAGVLDPAFGEGGQRLLAPYATGGISNTTVSAHLLSLVPGGAITAFVDAQQTLHGWFATGGDDAQFAYRIKPDGSLDTSFENGRRLARARFLQLDDGRILAKGWCLARLTTDAPRMAATLIEYRQPQLDRYFLTAEGLESSILDADTSEARWVRTGRTFGGWLPFDLPGAQRICRFVAQGGVGASHFYALEGPECDSLRALDAATPPGSPAWRFEGHVFSATAPIDGGCPTHLSPVYRAYNFGFERGALANHRYTTDPRVYDEMVGKGWGAEGVKFCVPPVISNIGTWE